MVHLSVLSLTIPKETVDTWLWPTSLCIPNGLNTKKLNAITEPFAKPPEASQCPGGKHHRPGFKAAATSRQAMLLKPRESH
jgi:hypothetical protein